MKVNREKYIEEVKEVLYGQLGDHFKTDIDDSIDEDLEYEERCEERKKGKIIRVDHYLVYWLNGTILGWEILTDAKTSKEEIQHEEIIPDFEKVVDNSRIIGYGPNGSVFYGEYCRL